jgi:hypothetical protein
LDPRRGFGVLSHPPGQPPSAFYAAVLRVELTCGRIHHILCI